MSRRAAHHAGCIVYWAAGALKHTAAAFFIFVSLVFMLYMTAHGLGVCISAATTNPKIGLAIAPALTVILMLFGGFYANVDT